MQTQSWLATIFFALIAFGGGDFAGMHAPSGASGTPPYGVGPGREDTCYFSPGGGCTQAIVNEIDLARHSVELLGYSFTSRPIGNALIAAHKRGVDVIKAAARQGVTPDRISFIDAARWLLSATPGQALCDLVVNPRRPDRHEPRVRKDRNSSYPFMTRTRRQLRKALKNKEKTLK